MARPLFIEIEPLPLYRVPTEWQRRTFSRVFGASAWNHYPYPPQRFRRPRFPNDLPAELRFKAAVHGLISMGVYPGVAAIRKVMGQPYDHCYNGRPTLSGRELKWRKEVCAEREFKLLAYGNPFFESEPWGWW